MVVRIRLLKSKADRGRTVISAAVLFQRINLECFSGLNTPRVGRRTTSSRSISIYFQLRVYCTLLLLLFGSFFLRNRKRRMANGKTRFPSLPSLPNSDGNFRSKEERQKRKAAAVVLLMHYLLNRLSMTTHYRSIHPSARSLHTRNRRRQCCIQPSPIDWPRRRRASPRIQFNTIQNFFLLFRASFYFSLILAKPSSKVLSSTVAATVVDEG